MSASDHKLFEEFFTRNYRRLFLQAYRIIENYHDAEDLVDEAFVIYYQKHQKEDIKTPDAYITGILSKLIGNYLRSKRRERLMLDPSGELPKTAASANGPPLSLSEAFPPGLLPWEEEILILRCEKKLSFKEIAAQLGIAEVSCRSRFFRAKAHCRELLLKENNFSENSATF